MRDVPRYVGWCCREWILAVGVRGTCGLCGETPTYLRAEYAACEECGNDDPTEGHTVCSDCLK